MSYVNTTVEGKTLRLLPNDTALLKQDDLPALLDLTGLPLKAGDNVAWGTSYRGGGGAVIGRVESVKWAPHQYSAAVLNEAGEHAREPYTYKDYRGVEQASYRFLYETRTYWRPTISVTSLTPGRKGRVETSADFFVKVANQEYDS